MHFFETGGAAAGWTGEGASSMPKPPRSTPHSDLDGVHQDEKSNIDSANEAGEDAGNLALAREESAGKPDFAEDRPNRDDRSH
jgi:hypothetical protein